MDCFCCFPRVRNLEEIFKTLNYVVEHLKYSNVKDQRISLLKYVNGFAGRFIAQDLKVNWLIAQDSNKNWFIAQD